MNIFRRYFYLYKLKKHNLFKQKNSRRIDKFKKTVGHDFNKTIYSIILTEKYKSIKKYSYHILSRYDFLNTFKKEDLVQYSYNIIKDIILDYEKNIKNKLIKLTNNILGNIYYEVIYENIFKINHNQNIKFIFDVLWVFMNNDNIPLYYKIYSLFDIFNIALEIAIFDLYDNINTLDLDKIKL